MYRWESLMAIRRLPKTQNNVVKYYLLQLPVKYEISSSAPG
jgi:hypothetical protein